MEAKILERLNDIFNDLFVLNGEITRETTSADVKGWASLMHITLISEVEAEFGVKFTMKQILNMQNVGEMIDLIVEKGGCCD